MLLLSEKGTEKRNRIEPTQETACEEGDCPSGHLWIEKVSARPRRTCMIAGVDTQDRRRAYADRCPNHMAHRMRSL